MKKMLMEMWKRYLQIVKKLLSIAGELKLLSRGIWRQSVLIVRSIGTEDFIVSVPHRSYFISDVFLPMLLESSNPWFVQEKPRIGGGFGAKQTTVCEVYPAFVTWMTKRPSKIIYSRRECQTIASPRHEMEVTVRLGAMKDGRIRAIDLYTLSNTGAYGEHGTTTVGLSGHKAIPLYTGGCEGNPVFL